MTLSTVVIPKPYVKRATIRTTTEMVSGTLTVIAIVTLAPTVVEVIQKQKQPTGKQKESEAEPKQPKKTR